MIMLTLPPLPPPPFSVKDVLHELQLERDTWQLMRGLYSDRLSTSEEQEEDLMEREVMYSLS